MSLPVMFFYIIPGLGPLIAIFMVASNTSHALKAQFGLEGFFKMLPVISAMYFCYFLVNSTIGVLMEPVKKLF
jgi:hypothetical protein